MLPTWSRPSDYGGFSPDGHHLIMSVHRDSDSLARSNWIEARKILARAAGLETVPQDDADSPVYDWRAGHWAVGWVEYLMVRPDAPAQVLEAAQSILNMLEDYPALNEDAWSELEFDEACETWAAMSVRDRADTLKRCGQNIFAARRAELPQDDDGSLMEYLR